MSIRGIDNQIIMQRAPETSKYNSDQLHRHDAFQKALSEQQKAKIERDAASVPTANDSERIQLKSEQKQGNGKKKSPSRRKDSGEAITGEPECLEEFTLGISIDIRI